jgi:hypothetical protein
MYENNAEFEKYRRSKLPGKWHTEFLVKPMGLSPLPPQFEPQ